MLLFSYPHAVGYPTGGEAPSPLAAATVS